MSATPQPVAPKAQLTYSLTVTNRGPANSGAVKVVQSLPAKSTFVSMSAAAGSCTKAGTPVTVTCNLTALPTGSSTTITVIVKVTATKGADAGQHRPGQRSSSGSQPRQQHGFRLDAGALSNTRRGAPTLGDRP